MSNNKAAISNSYIAAIWCQFPDMKNVPRYKESLFPLLTAIWIDIQSNVKHMPAILKSNVAAPWRNFWHCHNVPRHQKHRYRHLHFGPRCNRTGYSYYGQNYGNFCAIFEINMAATSVREFLGSIVLMIFRYHRTLVQSFMLCSITERFWWQSYFSPSTARWLMCQPQWYTSQQL